MATISDAFLVTVGLDPTSFKLGREEVEREYAKTKETATKTGKELERGNKTLADSFRLVRNETLGFFAALTAGQGLKDFMNDTSNAAAALGRLAQNIGAMPVQISGWDAAVERMGGTAEEAQSSLHNMAQALWQVHNTGQALPPLLYRLQAGAGKIAATRFDTEHGVIPFMNDIAAQAQKLSLVDPTSAHFLLTGAGISDATANAMIKYGAGMGAFVENVGKAIGPSKEAIKAAQDLQSKWAEIRQEVDGIANDAIPGIAKALKPVFKETDDFLKQLKGAVKTGPGGGFWRGEPFPNILTGPGSMTDLGAAKDTGLGLLHNLWGFLFPPAHGGTLSVQGQPISGSNPLPVNIVQSDLSASAGGGKDYGTPNSLLGGPLGSGGPLPEGSYTGGGGGRLFAPRDIRMRGTSGTQVIPPEAAGTYRPVYRLGPHDLSDAVVNTVAGEATGDPASIDAVIDNMMNRLGTTAYGPSGNLDEVARAPGQYAGYRRASKEQAALIRSRIRAIASGGVPDTTKGSNEYRAAWYNGPWGWNHPNGVVVGGNKFAYNPRGHVGPYAPYDVPHRSFPEVSAPGGIRLNPPADAQRPPPHYESPIVKDPGAFHPVYGARLSSLGSTHYVATTSNSNALHVGSINVDARGSDARGIGDELQAALDRSSMTAFAMRGQV